MKYSDFKSCFYYSSLDSFNLNEANSEIQALSLKQTYEDTTNSSKDFDLNEAVLSGWSEKNSAPSSLLSIEKIISLKKNCSLTKNIGSFKKKQIAVNWDNAISELLETNKIVPSKIDSIIVDFRIFVQYNYTDFDVGINMKYIYRVSVPGYKYFSQEIMDNFPENQSLIINNELKNENSSTKNNFHELPLNYMNENDIIDSSSTISKSSSTSKNSFTSNNISNNNMNNGKDFLSSIYSKDSSTPRSHYKFSNYINPIIPTLEKNVQINENSDFESETNNSETNNSESELHYEEPSIAGISIYIDKYISEEDSIINWN
jgi:hypothetical protein